MKLIFSVVGILIATAAMNRPAAAQNYPWCEYLGSGMGGAKNCGFVSFQQCMQSAWGNGGDCRQNPMYEPPPGPHPHVRKPSQGY
jgi:hypothetical protein